MGNLLVAVLGAPGYSSAIAKKGTNTDITLYDLKKGEDIVTLIEPTRYPERLAPLFFAVSEAKKAIVIVDELNATLGEIIVMLQCCNVRDGYFILRNFVPREKFDAIIKGTVLESFEFISDDPVILRDRLLSEAAKQKTDSISSAGTVSVDHAFNVKGVGAVVLGVVMNGCVEKHASLRVLPGTKTTLIRSIQKHDDEFEFASEGDRVGLALKNVEVENLGRGTVLTADQTMKSSKRLDADASIVKYWNTPIKSGMVLHLGHWMQFLNCTVETVSDDGDWRKPHLTLIMEKELVYYPGEQAVMTYLDNGKLRVAGTVNLD